MCVSDKVPPSVSTSKDCNWFIDRFRIASTMLGVSLLHREAEDEELLAELLLLLRGASKRFMGGPAGRITVHLLNLEPSGSLEPFEHARAEASRLRTFVIFAWETLVVPSGCMDIPQS